jgi:hypothetical protein
MPISPDSQYVVPPNTEPKPLSGDLSTRSHELAGKVLRSLDALLGSLPGGSPRPQELSRLLSLNKDLTSRLLMAIREEDPLSGIQVLPGRVPLRAFHVAAISAGASPALAKQSEEALCGWDRFVREEFGDRKSMHAALSDLAPGARRRQELASKQAIYRGMADIKGVSADTSLVTFVLHPSGDHPGRCDTLLIGGSAGVRRLRATATIQYTSVLQESPVGRRPIDGAGHDGRPILREFCSPQDLPIVVEEDGRKVHYTLAMEGAGTRTNADFFLREFYPGNHPLWSEDGSSPPRWVYATIDIPSRRLVFNVYLHRDLWVGCEPYMMIFDTAVNGVADPLDPARQRDQLDLRLSAVPIRSGPERFWCEGVARHQVMLESVASSLGWVPDEFRCFRCEIEYPMYGSEVCMLFRPPRKP